MYQQEGAEAVLREEVGLPLYCGGIWLLALPQRGGTRVAPHLDGPQQMGDEQLAQSLSPSICPARQEDGQASQAF